jgi:hypothetical protein
MRKYRFMNMNEISKKPKIRLLTKISLLLSIIFFILMMADAVAFHFYINSGGLNEFCGDVWFYLFLPSFLFVVIVLFAIICVIISVFKTPKSVNFITSVISLMIVLSTGLIPHFIRHHDPLRYWAHNKIDLRTLNWISKTIPKFAKDHEGKLPPADKWYKNLIEYAEISADPNINNPSLRSKVQQRFALNLGVAGMPLSEIDHNTVLVFESNFPENLVGGYKNITAGYHSDKGCVILFADMHIKFVRAEDFNNLRWKP